MYSFIHARRNPKRWKKRKLYSLPYIYHQINQKVIKAIKVTIAFGALLIGTAVIGQELKPDPSTISAGLELALPTGTFEEGWSMGVGGSLKMAFPIIPAGALTVSAGYIHFGGKHVTLPLWQQAWAGQTSKMPSVGVIPLKGGFRYKVNARLYMEPQFGFSIFTGKAYETDGALTYAGTFGLLLLRNQLDMSIRYEAASKEGINLSHLGLRTAWVLPVGSK